MWEWFTSDSSDHQNSQSESHSAKGLWCCINGAALWCVCAMSILISCLYNEGTNNVWVQAQHESSLYNHRDEQEHKQHGFFHYRKALWFIQSLQNKAHFPKKSQTQQQWVLFLKQNVKTTSFPHEVTTWHFMGAESAFVLLYPSYCVSVSWCCTQNCSKTSIWLLLEELHERFVLPCLKSL